MNKSKAHKQPKRSAAHKKTTKNHKKTSQHQQRRQMTTDGKKQRPFRVLGVQQIALGQLDKNTLMPFWNEALGIPKVGNFVSEKENVDEDILKINSGPLAVEIDIMQPLDANKSPKVHIPVLNHVGLWIDDLPKAVEYLTSIGTRFTPGGIRKGASGFDVCFVHPKGSEEFPIGAGGCLVELVQAPPEVIAALGGAKDSAV